MQVRRKGSNLHPFTLLNNKLSFDYPVKKTDTFISDYSILFLGAA